MTHDSAALKKEVHNHWNKETCAESYMGSGNQTYTPVQQSRYALIPEILTHTDFSAAAGKDVLEIGVGLGTDFSNWLKNKPKSLTGIDLTDRAIAHTKKHIQELGLDTSNVKLMQADAEALEFADHSFDIVYSWGVLHHSPNTSQAIKEVHRVLRPGGKAIIMIYHSPSIVSILLWIRYALLKGKLATSLAEIHANHYESPGTKAYSVTQTRDLFRDFSKADIHLELSHGDLLLGNIGERHNGGPLFALAKKIWPRRFIRTFCKSLAGTVVIVACK